MPVVISTAHWLCLMFINAYTVWTQARVVCQRVHHLFLNDSDVHAAWLLISSFDILQLLFKMLHGNKWYIAACLLFHVMWNAEHISNGCIMLYSFDLFIFPPYSSLTEVCVCGVTHCVSEILSSRLCIAFFLWIKAFLQQAVHCASD